ncbi:GAF domain-containing protein [Pseudoalteromonas ulvae]|uniref:Histidine kinase n=1 Tax=Pseudoalteromonas ulvae TaxID=107327 RepID=A0A244CW24_PSEDV|nr:histidine kinase [Pseudoalteromonas ulvae]OUL59439.1 histidine kinase [Pseudoalteromonas ulvae]
MVSSYLSTAGLECPVSLIESKIELIQTYLAQHGLDTKAPLNYYVPELGEGGSCSLFGHLQAEPFELSSVVNITDDKNLERINCLQAIVDCVVKESQVDWFGIYQKVTHDSQQQLVKLAYFGAESRACFPLNETFAALSNNVKVGLSKRARVINDIPTYLTEGGEYYTCDPKVLAESCLPLLSGDNQLLGIIDAEAFKLHFFDDEQLALLIAACFVIPKYLLN